MRCTICNRQYDGRADRKFSSAACRQKDYRKRQRDEAAPPLTDRLAELARLAGELDDELGRLCYPGSRIPRYPLHPAVGPPQATVVVTDEDARLARKAADF